jgi:sirohydrochlorin ferrochelatase
MNSAILLIAHGSRLQAANNDLLQIAEMLRKRFPDEIIECAYLELAAPTIPQGMTACVQRGASRVRMLPYFLSAGSHVSRDLEEHRRHFREQYPGVDILLCPPIGLHPLLVDVLIARLDEAEQTSRNPSLGVTE